MKRVQHRRPFFRTEIRRGKRLADPVLNCTDAAAVDIAYLHCVQIVQHEKICPITGRNRADALQTEALRCLNRRHLNTGHCGFSGAHRHTNDVVNMSVREQIGRMFVVRHEQAAAIIGRFKQREQRL